MTEKPIKEPLRNLLVEGKKAAVRMATRAKRYISDISGIPAAIAGGIIVTILHRVVPPIIESLSELGTNFTGISLGKAPELPLGLSVEWWILILLFFTAFSAFPSQITQSRLNRVEERVEIIEDELDLESEAVDQDESD